MIQDCRLIRPVFQACKRAYWLMADQGSFQSQSFDPLSFFCMLDSDWVADYVAEESDMTTLEVVVAASKDPKAPYQLLECVTDLPMNLKMLDPWAVRAVIKTFLDNEKIPGRLATFKSDGGLNGDGSLNWEKGPYIPIRNDQGVITKIQFGHNPGHQVEVTMEFSKDAKIMRGWSVDNAFIRDPPRAAIKLCSFFHSSGFGPDDPDYIMKKSMHRRCFQQSGSNSVRLSRPSQLSGRGFGGNGGILRVRGRGGSHVAKLYEAQKRVAVTNAHSDHKQLKRTLTVGSAKRAASESD